MNTRAFAAGLFLALSLPYLAAAPEELGLAKNAAQYRATLSGAISRGLEAFAIPVQDGSGWFSEDLTLSVLTSIDHRADGACPWYAHSDMTTERNGAKIRVVFKVRYKLPSQRRDEEIAQAESAAREIAEEAAAAEGELARFLYIHDRLLQGARYDERLERDGAAPPESYTPFGALVAGVCVCDGFSKAFLLVASMLDLECLMIAGQGDGGPHSWNLIRVDGAWYHVDLTFDLLEEPYGWARAHFMVDDAIMSRNHEWDREAYPACDDPGSDYYSLKGQSVADLEEAEGYLASLAKAAPGRYEFRVRELDPDTFPADVGALAKRKLGRRAWSLNSDWASGLVILVLKG